MKVQLTIWMENKKQVAKVKSEDYEICKLFEGNNVIQQAYDYIQEHNLELEDE
jgi:hypothetical protein